MVDGECRSLTDREMPLNNKASMTASPMKLLILGGTGPSGLEVIEEALARSHSLVIARSPSKLPDKVRTHPDVSIVEGNIHDENALFTALDGVDAVISALGPVAFQPSDMPITRGYVCLVKAMKARGVKRIVLLGTASIPDPAHDHRTLKSILIVGAISILARSMYIDIVAYGKLFMSKVAEGLDWTIVRIPILTNGPRSSVQAGYVGDGKVGWFLSRSDLGWFFVNEVEAGEWIGKPPMISSGLHLHSD